MRKQKTYINEDGAMDFNKFNLLTEAEQINEMEFWTPQQWIAYRMQNTISEEECFGPILAKIEKEIQENESGI